MSPDIWHLKWSGTYATVVSEEEDWANCDVNLPARSWKAVDLTLETPQRSQKKKTSPVQDMWLYLHHCWNKAAVGVCAIFISYVDTLSEFVIQVGEIRAWGSCRNSSGVQRPADSCGTSSVPLRILPKVLLPTKLWMNSELTQLWSDSWQLTERQNQIIVPWFAEMLELIICFSVTLLQIWHPVFIILILLLCLFNTKSQRCLPHLLEGTFLQRQICFWRQNKAECERGLKSRSQMMVSMQTYMYSLSNNHTCALPASLPLRTFCSEQSLHIYSWSISTGLHVELRRAGDTKL